MTFELVHKGNTAANAVFHVLDSAGTVCGSINVPRGQEDDLQRQWRGTSQSPARAAAAARPDAKLRLAPLSESAILRGC